MKHAIMALVVLAALLCAGAASAADTISFTTSSAYDTSAESYERWTSTAYIRYDWAAGNTDTASKQSVRLRFRAINRY